MKICTQCQTQMEEGYKIKVNSYGIPKIERGMVAKADEIKVTVCPKCGEVSLYVYRAE